MMTMVSTFLSFLAGGLPKILQIFQDRQDKKHELALAQIQEQSQLEMQKAGFQSQEHIEEIRTEQISIQAQTTERQALYAHDIEIGKGASQWVINLRAMVRPTITYGLFFLLVIIDIAGVWYAWTTNVPFNVMIDAVWDDDTQIIWASVISFYFGTRAFKI